MKSNLEPPITQSLALESYLNKIKLELLEATFVKIKGNPTKGERKVLKVLKTNKKINIKKADKDTATVIMNEEGKIKKGRIQVDNADHYKPIDQPMVLETAAIVAKVIKEMYKNYSIDEKNKRMASSNIKLAAYTRGLYSEIL